MSLEAPGGVILLLRGFFFDVAGLVGAVARGAAGAAAWVAPPISPA